MRTATGILALGLVLALYGGLHYYLWLRLVRAPLPNAPGLTLAGGALLALLALSVPAAMLAFRLLDVPQGPSLARAAFVWSGLALLLLATVAGTDLLRLALELGARLTGAEAWLAAHRLLATRLLAGLALGSAAILAAVGLRAALGAPRLETVTVSLARLAPELSGLKIAQLSDLHVGQWVGRDEVARVAALIAAQRPDALVITGDLVDGPVARLAPALEPLWELRPPLGVYFVTGNHEYYAGVEPWLVHLRAQGVRVLRNEHVVLGPRAGAPPPAARPDAAQSAHPTPPPPAASPARAAAPVAALAPSTARLVLAGIDDSMAGRHGPRGPRPDGHGADLSRALAGADPTLPVVLLAHQPADIRQAAAHGVDLQLSGHTHGGQLWPGQHLARLFAPTVAGLERHGDTWLYVSRGAGTVGPPLRLGAPPELTLLTLTAAPAAQAAPAIAAGDEAQGPAAQPQLVPQTAPATSG